MFHKTDLIWLVIGNQNPVSSVELTEAFQSLEHVCCKMFLIDGSGEAERSMTANKSSVTMARCLWIC